MPLTRRTALTLVAAALAAPAAAHHGWRWTSDGTFELTGVIDRVELGNPHGELTVRAEDEMWTVEIGQPWRNDRAGIDDDMLVRGREITAQGHRSADAGQNLMKAERLIIDGTLYNLYPDRS